MLQIQFPGVEQLSSHDDTTTALEPEVDPLLIINGAENVPGVLVVPDKSNVIVTGDEIKLNPLS